MKVSATLILFLVFSISLQAIVFGVEMKVNARLSSTHHNNDNSDHEIKSLPGLNHTTLNFRQYAGYVTVNETHGRNLFYWFVESQRSPSTDPVVVWLNGGPGCSSLTGLLTENGPYWVDKDGETLSLNAYSWNRVANVIYLENPSGVGYSFSDTPGDYDVGDARTASDAAIFMVKFFELFPALKDLPVYISGESYGGHYVPNFVQAIIEHNAKAPSVAVNIKGFLAGNAWTDAKLDNQGSVFDWYSHALISKATYDGIMKTCDFANIGPLYEQNDDCNTLLGQANVEMGRGQMSIYDIYANVCVSSLPNVHSCAECDQLLSVLSNARTPFSAFAAEYIEGRLDATDPCINQYEATYLNRKDVQEAIHIQNIPYEWKQCGGVHYSYDDVLTSVIPVYEGFIREYTKLGLDILVFSGDIDGIVPTPGSRLWIDEFVTKAGLTETKGWVPWICDKQVGGYVTHYDKGFTFCTVRGAGHMVPGIQPGRAFQMFSEFLEGKF